ncbi:MAG: hypothetical protein OEY99_07905 [Aigarchaeota archaeon]|nr:hypothetical protein [Aigarchaeota archaeon]MDH5704125.1 hypothetical protein [Aigarchaeota archaeon]
MVPFYGYRYSSVRDGIIKAAHLHGKEIVDEHGKRWLETDWDHVVRVVAGGSWPESLFERRQVVDRIEDIAKKAGWPVSIPIVYIPLEARTGFLHEDEFGLPRTARKKLETLRRRLETEAQEPQPTDRMGQLERKERIRRIVFEISGIRKRHGLGLEPYPMPDVEID